MDILIKADGVLSVTEHKNGKAHLWVDGFLMGTALPDHNDLADKSVIIERMGEVYEALYDKVDKKALSECHVAFLKAVMYAPTVIPSTMKIPTEGFEPKGVWDEKWTTESAVVLEESDGR